MGEHCAHQAFAVSIMSFELDELMLNLTRQQQYVIGAILLLLLTGWAVKTWRLAHPRSQPPVPPAAH